MGLDASLAAGLVDAIVTSSSLLLLGGYVWGNGVVVVAVVLVSRENVFVMTLPRSSLATGKSVVARQRVDDETVQARLHKQYQPADASQQTKRPRPLPRYITASPLPTLPIPPHATNDGVLLLLLLLVLLVTRFRGGPLLQCSAIGRMGGWKLGDM